MTLVTTELLILALLVVANGILAAAETAVVSARKNRLRQMADSGSKGAATAILLAEHPARFLALVQFWLTLSGMIAGVLAGAVIAGQATAWFARWPVVGPWAQAAAFVFVTLGLTSFMLVFGELVPKRIALANPEVTASLLGASMRALAWVATPILAVLGGASEGIARVIGIRPRPIAETLGDEEVRALVERGLKAGVFRREEKEMVEGVLGLDNLPVTAIMTPRPKIVFLNLEDAEEANWRKIVTSGHSYFPVYQGNRDQVVGMVSVKALWAHSAIGLPTALKNLLVPSLSVPESMKAIHLLEKFKQSGRHIAVVVDEFGVVQGLVTLIDVFEAIVGDLPEPGHRDEPKARPREDGALVIDATLPIAELKSLLGLTAPLPQETQAEYQTAGGFAVTQLGRIPSAGDRFECAGWRFEIAEMERRRVDKLLATRLSTQTAPGAGTEAGKGPVSTEDHRVEGADEPAATDPRAAGRE